MRFVIRSAMAALMPRGAGLPGLADTDVDAFLGELRRDADRLYWAGLCLGAILFTVTPLITVGLPLPSLLLPRRLLDLHAQRIVKTRFYLLRQILLVVRLSAGMCWGRDRGVRAHFGLPDYGQDPGSFRT